MDSLLEPAAALWRDSGVGHELRLIGGLAVRLHVEHFLQSLERSGL